MVEKVPRQWKKFLNVGQNKEQLIAFLVKQWKLLPPFALEPLNKLFVTCSNYCICFELEEDTIQVTEVEQLNSDHEEADTRMFLHAQHASAFTENTVIKSPDTDVFVIE